MLDYLKKIIVVFIIMFFLGGCAVVSSPVGDGLLITNVKGPVAVTSATSADKVGNATCLNVLGIVAAGDCSIEAAMKKGGITKVQHVDHKSNSILGIVSWFTTMVYGQ